MAAEVIESEEPTGDIIDLCSADALLMRRRILHRQLGEISAELVATNQRYHACIERIIQTNDLLRSLGYDTEGLARELQAEVLPTGAMRDYDSPDA